MSGPQNPGDNKFTAKARMLQSIHRASIGETEIGVGPTAHATKDNKPAYYVNMLVNGEFTGKNFHFSETYEYAKERAEGKSKVETIDKYRLFNNLLSSMPMAFNIFHTLMMIKKKYPDEIAGILQHVFPDLDIHQVDDIKIEFIPEPIKNYTNDKTAMDATILFSDAEGNKFIIAIEVKYTDSLGAKESGLFTTLGLAKVKAVCPQIYRNFLLTEKYIIVNLHHLARLVC